MIEFYYTFVLLLLLLFQKDDQGLVLNICVLLLVTIETPLYLLFEFNYESFFLSCAFTDFICIILLMISYNWHSNRLILIPFYLSLILNILLKEVYYYEIYDVIQPYYQYINIVLYEVTILICINNSPIPEKLNKLNLYLVSKIKGNEYDRNNNYTSR